MSDNNGESQVNLLPVSWKHGPFVQVVGLRGVAGAGKTTVRLAVEHALTLEREITVMVDGFASPIRRSLSEILITKYTHPEEYRFLAQTIGQYMRDRYPNFWVNQFRKRLRQRAVQHNERYRDLPLRSLLVVLLDDVRYPNEEEICDATFYIKPTFKPRPIGGCPDHESERYNRADFQLEPGCYPDRRLVVVSNAEGFVWVTANPIIRYIRQAFSDYAKGLGAGQEPEKQAQPEPLPPEPNPVNRRDRDASDQAPPAQTDSRPDSPDSESPI